LGIYLFQKGYLLSLLEKILERPDLRTSARADDPSCLLFHNFSSSSNGKRHIPILHPGCFFFRFRNWLCGGFFSSAQPTKILNPCSHPELFLRMDLVPL